MPGGAYMPWKIFALVLTAFLLHQSLKNDSPAPLSGNPRVEAVQENSEKALKRFEYNFDWEGTLSESESAALSLSPYWWLGSGAILAMSEGVGRTLSGNLDESDKWRRLYEKTNPIDTENGAKPQNIFRLVTKDKWLNSTQEVSFRLESYNESASPNRNESNGLLLLSRYLDEDSLYYAGVRVDGYAVIKKKYKGNYYTLAEAKVFPGVYNRESRPNLIPRGEWLRFKSEIEDLPPENVRITLSREVRGEWREILRATDTGLDAPTLTRGGRAGLRTDFMDVSFENYSITEK